MDPMKLNSIAMIILKLYVEYNFPLIRFSLSLSLSLACDSHKLSGHCSTFFDPYV